MVRQLQAPLPKKCNLNTVALSTSINIVIATKVRHVLQACVAVMLRCARPFCDVLWAPFDRHGASVTGKQGNRLPRLVEAAVDLAVAHDCLYGSVYVKGERTMFNETTMTRRQALVGAAGIAAAGAIAGACMPKDASADSVVVEGARRDANGVCIMGDWLGEAPEFADADIDEELEADIIVVGGGLSGVSAARAACEAGKSVILFEKCDALQCRHGEFAALGSKFYAEHWNRGNEGMKVEVVSELERLSGNRINQRLLNIWADNSGEAFDWFVGASEDPIVLETSVSETPTDTDQWIQPRNLPAPDDYDPAEDNYKCFFQATSQFHPSQQWAFDNHAAAAEATGLLTTYLATPVKKLLREADGPVTGVIAQGYEGKTYRATGKAVILATGDYASNTDMLLYYNPWLKGNLEQSGILYTSVDPEGKFANTGDGDRMGMWVGAKMEEGPHGAQTHNSGGALGVTAFLTVDLHGHRFMNEDTPAQEIDNRLHQLYKNTCYQIFDSAWIDEVGKLAVNHCMVSSIVTPEQHEANYWLQPVFGYATPTTADDAVDAGTAVKADTLEELVEMLDMDDEAKQATLDTVAKYNEAAKAGVDDEFGKNPKRMFPIENPPYYATPWHLAAVLPMTSGLETDEEFHVLDTEREAIPGLFAVGNNGGGRFAGEYPNAIPGISHSLALTSGMLAGRTAAAEI